MDQFFQQLRKIQKKERSNGTLARVEDSFYKDIHKYLDELRTHIGNDPFAAEQYLLKDTQRIATEICERREHKITDAAVVNIHRSYHLFAGKPQFDLIDTTPLNLTPEEEKFYFSLIDTLTSFAGLKAFAINLTGSLSYKITSIFSPLSSFNTLAILLPFSPITAPIGSTFVYSV